VHGVSTAEFVWRAFAKADVLDLALLHQSLQLCEDFFDGCVRINTVLVVQINVVCPKALQ